MTSQSQKLLCKENVILLHTFSVLYLRHSVPFYLVSALCNNYCFSGTYLNCMNNVKAAFVCISSNNQQWYWLIYCNYKLQENCQSDRFGNGEQFRWSYQRRDGVVWVTCLQKVRCTATILALTCAVRNMTTVPTLLRASLPNTSYSTTVFTQ